MSRDRKVVLPKLHRVRVAAERIRGHGPILDVGAGTCLLEGLIERWYVATDVAADLLEPGDNRLVCLAGRLPLRSGTFETVTCISVLQYVLDVEQTLDELHRVLHPGGQLIVLVPNIAYVRNRITLLRGRFPWSSKLDSWRDGTIRYFTQAEITPVFERAGFRIRDVACSGRLRGLRSRWPAALGADILFDLERSA